MGDENEIDAYRTVFESIYRRHDADELEASWSRFLSKIQREPPEDEQQSRRFNDLLNHLNEEDHALVPHDGALVVNLDWKAADTDLVWYANLVLARQGLDSTFSWEFYDPSGAEPQIGLYALDQWLRPQGHAVVPFSTDGDYHLAAIVSLADLPRLMDARQHITGLEYSTQPVFSEVPDDWQHDPAPDRPKESGPALFRLQWREPGHEKDWQGWSSNFDDGVFDAICSESEIGEFRERYAQLHPHRETRGREVPKLLVKDGAPDEWFVAVEEVAKRFGRVAIRFVNSKANEETIVSRVEDAEAARGWAGAARSLSPSQRLVTVADAKQL